MNPSTNDTNQFVQPTSEQVKSKKFPISIVITIIGICIIGFLLFYIWRMTVKPLYTNSQTPLTNKKQTDVVITPSINQSQIEESSTSTTLINRSCDKNGCLFDDRSEDAIIGFATLEGYYQSYDKKDWGDVDVTCDAIVVTKGNTTLIESFLKLVKQGNAINRVNDKGDLILNIDLGSVSEIYQRQIKSSTVSNPIKLDVIRILPRGRGAPGCTSFVDIIAVR